MKALQEYLALPYTVQLHRDEDGDFVASVVELPGCRTHGSSEAEALRSLAEVKALWLTDALERNHPIPHPSRDEELPSGKWLQRVPRRLHKHLVEIAKAEGVSLNQYVSTVLAEAVGVYHGPQGRRGSAGPNEPA